MLWLYRKRRYRCSNCDKRFIEKKELLPRYVCFTNRLTAKLIAALAELRSQTSLAREYSVSPTTINRRHSLVNFPCPQQLP